MRGVVFASATAVAGLASGAVLGTLGSLVPVEIRAALASLLSLPALILGGAELVGRTVRPLETSRETPKRWVHERGAVGWALRNGFALGNGAFSRVGFWLWYVVPLGAFFAGSPLLGAAIYGVYGVARGYAVWPIIWVGRRRHVETGAWLVARARTARDMAAAQLVLIAAALGIGVGA